MKPHETHWPTVINAISERLFIPIGSRNVVRDVFIKTNEALRAGKNFSGKVADGRGRNCRIQAGTEGARMIIEAIERSTSITSITMLVNQARRLQNPPIEDVSWSAVENFTVNCESILKRRRGTQKSGKDDEDSIWAKARVAFFSQLKKRLRLGRLTLDALNMEETNLTPIRLDEILWCDEKHNKTVLGCMSQQENLIC
jgi:hypothetical protein